MRGIHNDIVAGGACSSPNSGSCRVLTSNSVKSVDDFDGSRCQVPCLPLVGAEGC